MLALRTIVGPPVGLAGAESGLAAVLYARGEYAASVESWDAATRRLRGEGDPERDVPRYELGAAASEIALGRLASARARLVGIGDEARQGRSPEVFVTYIRVAALLAAGGGDAETAARLFAAVDRLVRDTGYADLALPPDRAALEGVRASLGEEAFGISQRVGESLTDSDVIALVDDLLDEPPAPRS